MEQPAGSAGDGTDTPENARERLVTWAGLVAAWADAARAAVALPTDGEGGRYRRAIAPAIGLQAITMALREIGALDDPEERPVAQHKAELGINAHAGELHGIWRGEPLPGLIEELLADARAELERSRSCGVLWRLGDAPADGRLVAPHPAELIAALVGVGFSGDALLPAPGVPLFAGSPAAFARGPFGGEPAAGVAEAIGALLGASAEGIAVLGPVPADGPVQVYRQFDFGKGGPVRDAVCALDAGLPAGQPLLVAAVWEGEPGSVPLPPRSVPRVGPLPVVVLGEDEV